MWQPTGQWRTAVMRWYGERPRCHWQTGRHPCFCEGSAGFGKSIVQVAVGQIDGVTLLPDVVWRGFDKKDGELR